MLIVAALNGTRSRLECPKVPLTAEDLATEAKRAVDAGAGLVHVHARKKDGLPAFDLFIEDVVRAIRGKVDVPISISTQRTRADLARHGHRDLRRAPRAARPRDRRRSARPSPTSRRIARRRGRSSRPASAPACDPSRSRSASTRWATSRRSTTTRCCRRRRTSSPSSARPTAAAPTGMAGTPHNVLRLADACRATFSRFDVVMSGQDEASPIAQAVAAAAGHHVRVRLPGRRHACRTAARRRRTPQLVEMAVRLAEAVGRHPMEPDDVRAMLR